MALTLYTIGHGNDPLEVFLERLAQHHIGALVDVRSVPYSRYVPHFNRQALQASIEAAGLAYRYAGDYLGGRPEGPEGYKGGVMPPEDLARGGYLGVVDYKGVARGEKYQKGLRHLLRLVAESPSPLTIMCSEWNPHECHRHHLITRSLLDPRWRMGDLAEVAVVHLLKEGQEAVGPADFEGAEQLELF
jgi:uncharacterized protein (DUF488 family)